MEENTHPWYADIINFLETKMPLDYNYHQRKKFLSDVYRYYWEELILYRKCADLVVQRCMLDDEMLSVLHHCHTLEYGGHFEPNQMAVKVLQLRFFWSKLFRDYR